MWVFIMHLQYVCFEGNEVAAIQFVRRCVSHATCVHMYYDAYVCWFLCALVEKNPYDRLTDIQTYVQMAVRQKRPDCLHSQHLLCVTSMNIYTYIVHAHAYTHTHTQSVSPFYFSPSRTVTADTLCPPQRPDGLLLRYRSEVKGRPKYHIQSSVVLLTSWSSARIMHKVTRTKRMAAPS